MIRFMTIMALLLGPSVAAAQTNRPAFPLTPLTQADMEPLSGAGCEISRGGRVILRTDFQNGIVRFRGQPVRLTRTNGPTFDMRRYADLTMANRSAGMRLEFDVGNNPRPRATEEGETLTNVEIMIYYGDFEASYDGLTVTCGA